MVGIPALSDTRAADIPALDDTRVDRPASASIVAGLVAAATAVVIPAAAAAGLAAATAVAIPAAAVAARAAAVAARAAAVASRPFDAAADRPIPSALARAAVVALAVDLAATRQRQHSKEVLAGSSRCGHLERTRGARKKSLQEAVLPIPSWGEMAPGSSQSWQ